MKIPVVVEAGIVTTCKSRFLSALSVASGDATLSCVRKIINADAARRKCATSTLETRECFRTGGESGILVGHFSYLTVKERDCDKAFPRSTCVLPTVDTFSTLTTLNVSCFSSNGMDGMDACLRCQTPLEHMPYS